MSKKKRKGPFTIKIYKFDRDRETPDCDRQIPSRTERRDTEAEAQELAKRTVRAREGRVEVFDANGDMCWNSAYSSPMPRAYPKM